MNARIEPVDGAFVNASGDALPFGGLWYTKPDDAIGYAKFFSRSHDAVIRDFREP